MMGYGAVSQPIKPQPMLDQSRAGTPEQYRKMAEYLATINLSAVDHWALRAEDAAAPDRPRRPAPSSPNTTWAARPPSRMTSWSIRTAPSGIRISARCSSASSIRRRSSSPNIRSRSSRPTRRTGLLSIEFDTVGKIWFDTMYQGSLGCLDPKTGEIKYYPLAAKWNDDKRAAQLHRAALRRRRQGVDQERRHHRTSSGSI